MTSAITLETDRLVLRRPCIGDVAPEAEFYATDRSQFVGGPMSREMVWRSIATMIGHWDMRGYGFFAVDLKDTGAYVGHVGPWYPHGWPEPEIGWTLMNGYEGKGYAHEAAMATRNWAYAPVDQGGLGWTTAISMIAPGNARSIALAQRLGAVHDYDFTHERYGDCGVWRHPSPTDVRDMSNVA